MLNVIQKKVININMKKSPAFQLYASDFLTDTSGFTAEEIGIHIRLMCYQWINGPFKDDLNFIARISGTTRIQLKKAWPVVGKKYKKNESFLLISERLEETRNQQKIFKIKQQKNGLKGGRPIKAITQTKPKLNPNHNPNHNPTESSSTSVDTKVSTSVPIGHPYSRLPEGDARVIKYLTDPEFRKDFDFRLNNPL